MSTLPGSVPALVLVGLSSYVGNMAQAFPAEFVPFFSADFGPARATRPDGSGGWSADSNRYPVARRDHGPGLPPSFLIERRDGGGVYHYSAPLAHPEIWDAIAALPEPRRWDFCDLIAKAASGCRAKGKAEGVREVFQAFAEGRLTKRKVRGQSAYTVTIEPSAAASVPAPAAPALASV